MTAGAWNDALTAAAGVSTLFLTFPDVHSADIYPHKIHDLCERPEMTSHAEDAVACFH